MKNKSIKLSIILFLLVNTFFIWDYYVPEFAYFLSIIFMFIGVVLFFIFLLKLGALFLHRFKNKTNMYSVFFIGAVLFFCYTYPFGIIKSSILESQPYLKATRIGTANCSFSIRLEHNQKFSETTRCFGVKKNKGKYTIKNDTVYFNYYNNSEAEINKTIGILNFDNLSDKDYYGTLLFYETLGDKKPVKLKIYELNKD